MKRILHTFYGVGASVVLVGALIEIGGLNYGDIDGLMLLKAGLAVEALVFFISAFDYSSLPKSEKRGYKWTIKQEKVDGTKD